MRRVTGSTAIRRAVGGVAATPSISRNHADQHNLHIQSALLSTNSNKSHWFSYNVARGVMGTMLFSVAATALVEEVHAKAEPKFCPNDVVLYQFVACPFCNKVKAFLDYYNIPYKIVEVNPLSKKEIQWSAYKNLPVLTVDGERMVNSSVIIDKLSKKINGEDPHESAEEEDSEEKKWRGWVDNHLVPILSFNLYGNTAEALESLDYITSHGNFSFTERIILYAGADAAYYFISKRLKKKYNITDARAALYEAAETWVVALDGRDFLGGVKPNLADLAVFGVLRTIRNLKSGRDILENTRINDWFARMENVVGVSAGIRA